MGGSMGKNQQQFKGQRKAIDALKKAYTEENVTTKELKELALTVKNWTDFRNEMWERYEVEV